jgi:hypothetical protein
MTVKFLYQTVRLQPQLRLEQITIQQGSLHKNKNVDILFALFFLIFTTQINVSKFVDLTAFYILSRKFSVYLEVQHPPGIET